LETKAEWEKPIIQEEEFFNEINEACLRLKVVNFKKISFLL
jgi:hypothetical protein